MKICKYRNCKNFILRGRKDKQYCNGSCKRMEQTYRKREKIKYEKVIKLIRIPYFEFNNIDNIVDEHIKELCI